jgi:dihydrofolate reductase
MRCSVYIATSLDGFIARKDGGLDWLSVVEKPGEDYGYAAFAATVDAIIMGRSTYDIVLGFGAWPYEGKRMLVMTHRPAELRPGVELYAGEPAALVERLAAEGVRRVYVDGGVVIRQFLAAGLIDDVTVSVIPVLLGEGIPLFGAVAAQLVLDGVESWPSGLAQLRYTLRR